METGPDVEYPGVVEDLGWMQARCRLSSGVQRVRFGQSVSSAQFSPVCLAPTGSKRWIRTDRLPLPFVLAERGSSSSAGKAGGTFLWARTALGSVVDVAEGGCGRAVTGLKLVGGCC